MIDLEVAKSDLTDWVINFLDVPQKVLNDIAPCPFAKTAVIKNKINFVLGTESIVQDMLNLNASWDENYEGVVLIYPPDVNSEKFVDSVNYVNEMYYQNSGLIALEDHPQINETICNINFNNKKYAIVIIQKSEKLRNASEILNKRGYYRNWTQYDLNTVVNWRW